MATRAGKDADAALLPGGFHDAASLADIERLCVSPFPGSATRPVLLRGLGDFCRHLAGFGLPFEIWIDGSFLTVKENPNDVDVVIQIDLAAFERLPVGRQDAWAEIFLQNEATLARWRVDAYMFFRGARSRAAYWEQWYGHTRMGEAKGILRMMVTP